MSQRAKEVAARITSFSEQAINFVEELSAEDWNKVCDWEQWTVGVTARHLGAGHLAVFDLIKMIVNGNDLPPLTMDQVNAMSKKDAQEHADCTKDEALALLRENGPKMAALIAGLSDDDLDRKGSMPAFGGEFTTEQFIEMVIFENGTQHFNSMKSAVTG